MPIRVEFYGIARQRAGVGETSVEVPGGSLCLADLLCEVARRFPELAGEGLVDGSLPRQLTANVDGQRFVRAPQTRLLDGQSLLLMSADAGG